MTAPLSPADRTATTTDPTGETLADTQGNRWALDQMAELTSALHRVFDPHTDTVVVDGAVAGTTCRRGTGRVSVAPPPGADLAMGGDGRGVFPPGLVATVGDAVLGYADGIAKACQLPGHTDRAVVAVVDAAALGGGLAWEGLNHLADAPDHPVIVVLNDGHAHPASPGGLALHLRTLQASVLTGPECHTCGSGAVAGNLFTALGLAYLGPVDGHDSRACERALRQARRMRRPVIVHCVTHPRDQRRHHLQGTTLERAASPTAVPIVPWPEVFADELAAIAASRGDVVAIAAAEDAMSYLAAFAARFPRRTYDVGAGRGHAAFSAAGLATGGLHPVVMATAWNPAWDQVLMDAAGRRLPLTLALMRRRCGDRHGIGAAPRLPGVGVADPRDPGTLREVLREAVHGGNGPTVMVLPAAEDADAGELAARERVDGIDVLVRDGPRDVLLVAAGGSVGACLDAARRLRRRGVGVTVLDPRWVLPVNPALADHAARHDLLVAVESAEGVGAGGMLARLCRDARAGGPVHIIGPGSASDLGPSGAAVALAIAESLGVAMQPRP